MQNRASLSLRRPNVRPSARRPAAWGGVLLFVLSAVPSAAAVRVVEDAPGRLVLAGETTEYRVTASEGGGGSRVTVPGAAGPSATGAPDLPWLRFRVATGDRMPRVTVEPLTWTELVVPGGLAGVPRWITNREAEPARDAALFAAARGLVPEVSDIVLHRGMKLRDVAVPLAVHSGGAGVSLMTSYRVRVDFPDPAAAPAPGTREWLEHAGVKNVAGGAHLTSVPRSRPLRRTAATAAFDPDAARIRIDIGDRVVDGHDEDGWYALTYARLAETGLPAGVNPGALRLYTGPKDTLTTRLDGPPLAPTLREVPLDVRDANGNNTFDAGDTILFYGHGTSIWVPIAGAVGPVQWMHKVDPWSFENRYYLQWDGPAGAARIATASATAAADTVASAPHYLRAERDLETASCDLAGIFDTETGHVWYWHGRTGCTLADSAPITLGAGQLRPQSWSEPEGRTGDTTWLGFFNYLGHAADDFDPYLDGGVLPYVAGVGGDAGAWYLKTGDGALFDSLYWNKEWDRFDGYTVRYRRNLAATSGRVIFPAATGAPVAYRLTGASSGLRVLKVVDGLGSQWLPLQRPGGGVAVFADSAGAGEDVTYHLVGVPRAAPALTLETPVTADGVIRDLSDGSVGGSRQDPEYLIIAPAALLPEAVQLRNYRQDDDRLVPMTTAVARLEDVYREWSGGRLSPVAIRDMLRWAVNRWGPGDAPGNLKYVLLFGDGHYDYRDIRNGSVTAARANHVPPFNWQEAANNVNPMNTDDFYAVLDSGADWRTSSLTVSIGRLALQDRNQAANYLAKIARYEDPASSGDWRSRVLLIGDDDRQRTSKDGAGNHTLQADNLGEVVLARDSGMRAEKLYLFDYPSNGAFLKPEATQDLINQYNRGVLYSTYFGHGAHNQLADEVLLKSNDGLSRIRNPGQNFFMTVFSCTVGRFDKLSDDGMSEQFVRQKDYGAISAVSASRETYATPNSRLGNAFTSYLFDPAADTVPRMTGDAIRIAKTQIGIQQHLNNPKYLLQGEPVLVVNRPGIGLTLDTVPDTLSALGCDTLTGRVSRGSGRGAVNLRIVSSDVMKDYAHDGSRNNPPEEFTVRKRGQILFERTVPYVDSAFSLPFYLPKQVPFGDTAAKLQIFAWDSLETRESAVLVEDMKISGTTASSSCLVDDQRGPRITVTGCNVREGGEVDFPDKVTIGLPYCLQIAVSDTGGGVLSGEGPDQGVTVEVVGSVAPFQPQAGVDDLSYKTYQLSLSEQQVPEGTHLLKISARDGFGNLTQRQMTLQVAADTALRFVRAFNVPNPMRNSGTTFWFSTTLPVEQGAGLVSPNVDRVDFHVRVYNQRGYLVREFRDARSGETTWDGRDAWGRRLANGVYFYDVTATWSESNGGPQGGRRVSRKNVLVISR